MTTATVPKGLSAESRVIWENLTTLHRFESHELVAFTRALRWFDRADTWLKAADAAEGREGAQLVKQAMDASNAGLRYWRTLKFTDGAAARRPGRPSDDAWSAKRKAQKLRQVI